MIVRESLEINNKYLPISTLENDEIFIHEDNIYNIFENIGEGVDDIIIDSIYSPQTGEYSNTVTIIFNSNTYGSLSTYDVNNIEEILDNYIGEEGFENYIVYPSLNKVELEFDTTYELGY